jgi:hypothetical protein
VFEDGYSSTIPPNELAGFERGFNDQGQLDVLNNSLQTTVARNPDQNYVVLGGVFLSQNYLRVDYSKAQFSLAQAIVGPVANSANASSIVSTCVPGPLPPPPSPPAKKKKLSKGAIAGIVVGSIIGAVLLVVVGLVIFNSFTFTPPPPVTQNGGMQRHSYADRPIINVVQTPG